MTHCSLKEFYVYPPAPVSPQIGIDISYVRVLPTITATTDTFPVDDYFAPAIQSGCFTQYGAAMMSNHLTTVQHKAICRRF